MLRQDLVKQSLELLKPVVAPPDRGLLAKIGAYLSLTKPRIIVLLLVTTVPTMIIAQGACLHPGWCC